MIEISHQQAHHLIRQSLDGRRLPEEQWSALQLHLDGCEDCRAYRNRLAEVERDLRRSLRARLGESYRELNDGAGNEIARTVVRARAAWKKARKIILYSGLSVIGLLFFAVLGRLRSAETQLPTPTPASSQGEITATPSLSQVLFRGVVAFAGPAVETGSPANSEIYLFNPGGVPGQGELVNLTGHPANDTYPAWSPDGEWLAFLSDREVGPDGAPKAELYVMHISGSRLTRLTNEPGVAWSGPLSWSFDGNWIGLTGQRGPGSDSSYIYLAPTNGGLLGQGPVRALAFTRGAPGPARFAPTSLKLAFGSYEPPLQGLMVFDLSTGRFSQITGQEVHSLNLRVGIRGEFDWTYPYDRLVYLAEGPFDPVTGGVDRENLPATSLWTSPLAFTSVLESQSGDQMEIYPGAGGVRGVIAMPGEFGLAAVYLRDERGEGCWTIHVRQQRVGFYETIDVTGLCVQGTLSRASWNLDSGEEVRPWLFVLARQGNESSPAIYAVRLPDGSDGADVQIERVADLPFPPEAQLEAISLEVRPERQSRLDVSPSGSSLRIKPEPVEVPGTLPGQVVFSTRDGSRSQLFLIRPDGKKLRELGGIEMNIQCPALAPNGNRLAFVATFDSADSLDSAVGVMDSSGKNIIRLTDPAEAPPEVVDPAEQGSPQFGCPAWSPDGTRLAAVYTTSGGDYLALIPADGEEAEYIRMNPVLPGAGPVWSEDGSSLALATQPVGDRAAILMLEVESVASGTAAFKQLSRASTWESIYGLVFHGENLAYITATNSSFGGNTLFMNWINQEGERPWERVELPNASLPYFVGRNQVTVLPDGRLAVLVHARADALVKTRIVVVDPQEGQVNALASLEDIVYDAAWSPDGEWLVYASESGLYVLNAKAGEENQALPARIFDGRAYMLDWR